MGVMRHIPRETTTATFTVISLFARPDVQKKIYVKLKPGSQVPVIYMIVAVFVTQITN